MRLVLKRREDIAISIEQVLSELLLDTDRQKRKNDIKLCLYEVLANAIIHGNGEDTTKNVYMQVVDDDFGLVVLIRDEGFGCHKPCIPFSLNLLESGRGLYLVEQIADKFCYNEKTNTWTIEIKW